jgi:hypothetical protein
VNGKFIWAAVTNPKILSLTIAPAITDTLDIATAFSLDGDGRLISRHLNGTHYANVDQLSNFVLWSMMERDEIRRRGYNYLRCSLRPPSGKYNGNYKELYCLADHEVWRRDVWNYCPDYKELFNAPFVLAEKLSVTPPCSALVLLVRPICGWT